MCALPKWRFRRALVVADRALGVARIKEALHALLNGLDGWFLGRLLEFDALQVNGNKLVVACHVWLDSLLVHGRVDHGHHVLVELLEIGLASAEKNVRRKQSASFFVGE